MGGMNETWTGQDRRAPEGVLLSVMNHVSEQIEAVERRHEARYVEFDRKITSLTDSVNAWMEREPSAILEGCERMIDEAIPAHPENPEATPSEKRRDHRHAHAKWIANVTEEMARWKRLREKAIDYVVIGGLGVILVAVWSYLSAGPKG